jgi:hypothetical protein
MNFGSPLPIPPEIDRRTKDISLSLLQTRVLSAGQSSQQDFLSQILGLAGIPAPPPEEPHERRPHLRHEGCRVDAPIFDGDIRRHKLPQHYKRRWHCAFAGHRYCAPNGVRLQWNGVPDMTRKRNFAFKLR